MPKPEGLKFGILCNSLVFHRWQAEIIRMLVVHGHKPSLLVLNAEKDQKPPAAFRFRNYPWKYLLYRLHQRFIFKPTMKQEADLSEELKTVPVLKCKVHKVDFSEFFSGDDVVFIRDQNLDFILRFGFNIIRGEILLAARYGIWSYHHGDELKYRGGPPCFWEIYRNDPVTGAVLQKLNEKLDAGIILRKGRFATVRHSYTENLDRVYAGSIPWVLQVCNDIQACNAEYLNAPGSITKAPVHRIPANTKMFWFGIKLAANRILHHLKDIFLHEKWNVGLIDAPLEKVTFNWAAWSKKIKWLPEPNATVYAADPFIYSIGDYFRIVFEKYDYRKMQGCIAQVDLAGYEGKNASLEVLNDGSHFSFPYVFEHETEIYCIPENKASGKTRLYRLECNERSFEPVAELLPIPLVDPVLLRWGKYWWYFGTSPDYPSEQLNIFYAEKLSGPYLPHFNNPVKTDIGSARPAGKPFVIENALYRPAQNCTKTYGGSIVINQVINLSPEEFEEQVVKEVGPMKSWKNNQGMHTISGCVDNTVIDAKRLKFIPVASWNKLMQKAGMRI